MNEGGGMLLKVDDCDTDGSIVRGVLTKLLADEEVLRRSDELASNGFADSGDKSPVFRLPSFLKGDMIFETREVPLVAATTSGSSSTGIEK